MQAPLQSDAGLPTAGEGTRLDSPSERGAGASSESPSVSMSGQLHEEAHLLSSQSPKEHPEEQSKDACQTGSVSTSSGKQSRNEPGAATTSSPLVLLGSTKENDVAVTSLNGDMGSPAAAEPGTSRNVETSQDPTGGHLEEDSEMRGEQQVHTNSLLPHQSVRFRLTGHLSRGRNNNSEALGSGLLNRSTGDSSLPTSKESSSTRKAWTRLKAAGYAAPGANAATAAATAAGKRAARIGREAARRSAMKATKAMKALKAVQGEIDSASRLQRMFGIQKYTEDDQLQQLAETEALLSPEECLQYDLKVLQYYTNTEKDIELRNRRSKALIYTPAAQIFMAVIIILNTVFLGISTMEISNEAEKNSPTQPRRDNPELIKWNKALFIFLTVSNAAFAIIFFVEMILRIKCDRVAYFKDFVNVTDFVNAWLGIFDLFIAVLHYTERVNVDVFQSVAAILRLVRLLRVLRFIRILKAFLPMRVLVDGMTASFFSLVYAVLFFVVLVYGVAVFFTTAFGTTQALHEYWGDLFTSMYTLFLILTMTNWDVVAAKTAVHYGWAKAVIVLYTVFSFFVLFNVVTAVIVEAFSSTAQRLQAEALHFSMFEECQDDEKAFSRALTRGNLLNFVSGVSLDKQGDESSVNAAYSSTYRGSGEQKKSEKSTKFTQDVPASQAQEVVVERQEPPPDSRPEESHKDGDKVQPRTEKVCVPTGEPAGGPAVLSHSHQEVPSHSSSSSDTEPVNEKAKLLPSPSGKFPSSLFASFVRPSLLARHKDSHSLLQKRSQEKPLRSVRGVLTTRSGNTCSQTKHHKDADNSVSKNIVAGKVQGPQLRSGVEQPVIAEPETGNTIKDLSSSAEKNTSATNSMFSTQGPEKTATPHPGSSDERTDAKAFGEETIAEEFSEAGVLEASGTGEDDFVETAPTEGGLSSNPISAGQNLDYFGNNCGRVYDEGLLAPDTLNMVSRDSEAVFSIDLRRYSPLQVLGTRTVQLAMRVSACLLHIHDFVKRRDLHTASNMLVTTLNCNQNAEEIPFLNIFVFFLQKCGISYIQAYDCLNILIQKGFEEVTVPGFLTCCRRVVGRPSARQLFLLELDLDRAFRHLNAKVSRAVALMESISGVEGIAAWPSTFASSATRSGIYS